MKRFIILAITILPYLFMLLLASIGHLLLCLWFWKRPLRGYWIDNNWFYKRFLRDMENELSSIK